MKAESTILSRAETPEGVAGLCARATGALLAECEEVLCEHLRACRLRHVRRMVEVSREESSYLPHFTAIDADMPLDIYVVSVCNMDAAAGLTPEQCRYSEKRSGRAVCVLPCVVQHLREGVARCVALPPVELRRKDAWHTTPEALQYLPLSYSRAAGVPMPCSAWLLKKCNLLREVANHGTRLYPMVRKFAHAGHLPEGVEVRGSGAESPLLLTVASGQRNGRLQLLYGDFYSVDNAVNELVVKELPSENGAPFVGLAAVDGKVYYALCAELQMFPEHKWEGRRFLWSLSMLCHHMSVPESGQQVGEYDGARMCVEVLRSRRCTLSGLPLCHLVARNGAQVVNIYAAVYDDDAPLPRSGDHICAEGVLYASPDALVPTSVEEVAPKPVPAAPFVHEELLQDAPALAVVAGGLLAAGYEMLSPCRKTFRAGLPELRMRSPEGTTMLVPVDTVVNGHPDTMGYFRYAPDRYPTHVTSAPPDNAPADVLFATVSLTSLPTGGYDVSVALHGAVPPNLTFCTHVEHPAAAPLSEAAAAQAFGEMMIMRDFSALLPLLREDVLYDSSTAATNFHSKYDLLRHLRGRFDEWQTFGDPASMKFLLSSVETPSGRRPCTVAQHLDTLVSATVFDVTAGRIAAIHTLSGSVLATLKPLDS